MTHLDPNSETKSAPADVAAAFEEFQRGFEAFKEGNDQRVGRGEKEGGRASPTSTRSSC